MKKSPVPTTQKPVKDTEAALNLQRVLRHDAKTHTSRLGAPVWVPASSGR
jgi:hypothetical protein